MKNTGFAGGFIGGCFGGCSSEPTNDPTYVINYQDIQSVMRLHYTIRN